MRRRRVVIFALFAALFACSPHLLTGGETPVENIEAVLKRNTGRLMAIPGVVGTAEARCEGKPCIKIYVAKKTPEIEQQLPPAIEGYPVVIQETGTIRPLER